MRCKNSNRMDWLVGLKGVLHGRPLTEAVMSGPLTTAVELPIYPLITCVAIKRSLRK